MRKRSRAHEAGSVEAGSSISKSIFLLIASLGQSLGHSLAPNRASQGAKLDALGSKLAILSAKRALLGAKSGILGATVVVVGAQMQIEAARVRLGRFGQAPSSSQLDKQDVEQFSYGLLRTLQTSTCAA